ncbi:MAG TPA: hypothetical protein VNO50_20190 [Pyrinomonadaceae bacterium]|nr:hypothetical protein [Pyrinomonadaceae bacterium]
MDDTTNAQSFGREILESLDREFARLHLRSRKIIESTPAEILYRAGSGTLEFPGISSRSVGECILRGAAAIEQTFGGITSNLWDDPFEWTLPEFLTTPGKVLDHLEEVEATRGRAFSSFADDRCLRKRVATPAQETELLISLLLETLVRAISFQTQGALTLKSLSGISVNGFII